MQHAVGNAFNAFGTALDTKFKSLEEQIAFQKDANVHLNTRVKNLESEVTTLQESMTKKCDNISSGPPTFVSSQPARVGPSHGKIPFESRVVARIGNLGWDDSREVILTRAREALEKAGINPSDYVGLCATRDKGSLAE